MNPYSLITPTPFRTWATDYLAGLMNRVSDCVCEDDECGDITWRDHLRWWLEARLSWLFGVFYDGSADELRAVIHGEIPEEHWNDRQRAFYDRLLCDWLKESMAHAPVRMFFGVHRLQCPNCGWQGWNSELSTDDGTLLGGMFAGLQACPDCDTLEGHLKEVSTWKENEEEAKP